MNRLQRIDHQTLRNLLTKEAVDRKIEEARERQNKKERSICHDQRGTQSISNGVS